MGFFLEVLIGGLLAGVLYSLVALGFVLIYKASGVFNYAQGSMVFFAALTCVSLTELGWPLWVALIVAAMIVLAYISLGGLSAAIYNEVLQFFVIVASLLPLVIIGLHRVGGWSGLKAKITAAGGTATEI